MDTLCFCVAPNPPCPSEVEKNAMTRPWIHALVLLVLARGGTLAAQPAPGPKSEEALKLFLDCNFCDLDFFRREIPYVNYVRDRRDADLHLLITTRRTGAVTEFQLTFVGRRTRAGIADTLIYASSRTDTQDEQRAGLARTIKMGLMPYLAGTPLADRIRIVFTPRETGRPTAARPEDDPWNFWVFRLRGGGNLNGEETTKRYGINGSFSANRTTEDWKITLVVRGNYNESRFDLNDSTTFVNTTHSYGASGLLVRSISDHWSIGGRLAASSSTFLNQDLKLRAAPGIEFNIFPYDQSSSRQLTVQYNIGINRVNYEQETIFNRTEETIFDQSLSVALNFVQPWGRSNVSLVGTTFLDDLDRNRLDLFGSVNIRFFRGLSFNIFGNVSRIRDQVFLPKGGASDEEILLRRRQLQTGFRYFTSLGFTYTFGSIFNNVVNPRFDSGGGGEIRFF